MRKEARDVIEELKVCVVCDGRSEERGQKGEILYWLVRPIEGDLRITNSPGLGAVRRCRSLFGMFA